MSDIFLSYSSKDLPKARILVEALAKLGWSVWWDHTIPAGKTYAEVIEEALGVARCQLVLWSSNSVMSNWVKEEADEGLNRGILVPVLIEAVKPPLGYRRIQSADLVDWDGMKKNAAFDRLVSDIAMKIGPSQGVIEEERQRAEQEAERKALEERRRAEDKIKRVAEEESERLAVEEERRKLEREAKRRAEEETKHKDEERRKVEEESKRLEIEKRRIAEEKQKRVEAKRKAVEEQRQKEAEPTYKDLRLVQKGLGKGESASQSLEAAAMLGEKSIQIFKPTVLWGVGFAIGFTICYSLYSYILRDALGHSFTTANVYNMMIGAGYGLCAAIVFRIVKCSVRWQHFTVLIIAWAIVFALGGRIWPQDEVERIIAGMLQGGILGIITASIAGRVGLRLERKMTVIIAIGWAIFWPLASLSSLLFQGLFPLSVPLGGFVRGTLLGSVLFWQLSRKRQDIDG